MSSAAVSTPLTLRNKARGFPLIWENKKAGMGVLAILKAFSHYSQKHSCENKYHPPNKGLGPPTVLLFFLSTSLQLPPASPAQAEAPAETHHCLEGKSEGGRSGGDPGLWPRAGVGASAVTTHPGMGKAPDPLFPS